MRILLAAPYEHEWDFGRYVARGLKDLGHDVRVFDYRKQASILGKRTYLMPLARKLGAGISNHKLKKEVVEYEPDIILVLKGESVLPKTIEWIRNELSVPTVLWFPDDPQHFDDISKLIAPAYDYVFTSSIDCISKYHEIGVTNVKYIPFACEPFVHKHIELTNDEYACYGSDLCFVGTYYPEREKILKPLAPYDMKIWGSGWDQLRNLELKKRYTKKSISVVKVFNASKIVLNVHHEQMKYGGMKSNLRTFEATGCRAFILSDRPKGIEDLFNIGKELVCYNDEKELIELVGYYLDNPEERAAIAEKGQKRAYRDHTIKHRMEEILSSVRR